MRAAMNASMRGDLAESERQSGIILGAIRELSAANPDSPEYRAALAAALYNHAGRMRVGRVNRALVLLAEAGEHYEALAAADPVSFELRRIDVLVRRSLVAETSGDLATATSGLREAIRLFVQAQAADRSSVTSVWPERTFTSADAC